MIMNKFCLVLVLYGIETKCTHTIQSRLNQIDRCIKFSQGVIIHNPLYKLLRFMIPRVKGIAFAPSMEVSASDMVLSKELSDFIVILHFLQGKLYRIVSDDLPTNIDLILFVVDNDIHTRLGG